MTVMGHVFLALTLASAIVFVVALASVNAWDTRPGDDMRLLGLAVVSLLFAVMFLAMYWNELEIARWREI